MDQIKLIENVDNQIISIRTKSLDVSFNEIYDMYTDKELIITPEYQRLFRWNIEKQSRFIESLLLEMPVPPIFVIEEEDGVYELIDGLQRISSYLHFRGAKIESETAIDTSLSLMGCDIIKDLDGMTYDTLPKPLQIKLKRSFVRMEVIRKESDRALKYHMFKRLNGGGEILSDQEMRNCTIRILSSTAIDFVATCAKNQDFKAVTATINQDKIAKKFDHEIVLRFFALKNDLEHYRYPVADFLTSFLEKITDGSTEFDFIKEKELFDLTFKVINKLLGSNVFSSKGKNGNYKNDFVAYFFDAISIAISRHAYKLNELESIEELGQKLESLKNSNDLNSFKTGSLHSTRSRISLFEEEVKKNIGTD